MVVAVKAVELVVFVDSLLSNVLLVGVFLVAAVYVTNGVVSDDDHALQ